MAEQEKRIEAIMNDLQELPKGVVYILCASLIASVTPEKFYWDELKEQLTREKLNNAEEN